MTSRLLALPAILIALFALSGCFQSNDPEQAPAPRAQGEKTKAELLIGKWKLIKRTPPNPGGPEKIFEYTQDGKVTMWVNEQVRKSRVESGTYRVQGNTLFRTFIGPGNTLKRNTTIDSITEDKLVTVYWDPADPRPEGRQTFEYERVREKKE